MVKCLVNAAPRDLTPCLNPYLETDNPKKIRILPVIWFTEYLGNANNNMLIDRWVYFFRLLATINSKCSIP